MSKGKVTKITGVDRLLAVCSSKSLAASSRGAA